MAARRRPRPNRRGAPSMLTDEVEKKLIDATKMSVPAHLAAEAAGISRGTFFAWLARGRDEEDARAKGKRDPDEEPYYLLWLKVQQARAEGATRGVLLVQRAAAGGVVTKTTKRTFRDHDGNLVEEVMEERTPPDWRAASFLLKTQHAREFSEKQSLELSGPDGEALTAGVDTDALAAKVTANIAAAVTTARAQHAIAGPSDADGIVDGDVVDG